VPFTQRKKASGGHDEPTGLQPGNSPSKIFKSIAKAPVS